MAQTKRKPTIKDVAERVGVSSAAVSYALQGKGSVSEATRRRVLSAARELGYPAKVRPASLSIGVLYPPGYADGKAVQDHEIYGRFVSGIQSAVSEIDRCTVSYIPNHPSSFVYRHFQQQGLDGMVFFGVDASHKTVKEARSNDIPCVMLNHRGDNGVSSIQVAHYDAMWAMAEHLMLDHGYRRLAFCQSDPAPSFSLERLEGAEAAVRQRADDGAALEVYRYGRSLEAAALAMVNRSPAVEAVIADRVVTSLRLMDELERLGRRVPEDIAVVGFDDLTVAREGRTPITTVRFDAEEMGRRAVLALASIAAGEMTEIHVKLPWEIVRRASCGCRV